MNSSPPNQCPWVSVELQSYKLKRASTLLKQSLGFPPLTLEADNMHLFTSSQTSRHQLTRIGREGKNCNKWSLVVTKHLSAFPGVLGEFVREYVFRGGFKVFPLHEGALFRGKLPLSNEGEPYFGKVHNDVKMKLDFLRSYPILSHFFDALNYG